MPKRPPKCRIAEIARTFSELRALPPKLAGKRCSSAITDSAVLFYHLSVSVGMLLGLLGCCWNAQMVVFPTNLH